MYEREVTRGRTLQRIAPNTDGSNFSSDLAGQISASPVIGSGEGAVVLCAVHSLSALIGLNYALLTLFLKSEIKSENVHTELWRYLIILLCSSQCYQQ